MATNRLHIIEKHLKSSPVNNLKLSANNNCSSAYSKQSVIGQESDDDVVIVAARRTPICKANRGGFKDTSAERLLIPVFQAVLKDGGLKPNQIGDICVGNVLKQGSGASVFRMAQLLSGFPETVPLFTCNRQCSSGLQAVMNVANSIKNGVCDIGIGAGVESMSEDNMNRTPPHLDPEVFENTLARECLIPMGITSENVADRYGISRQQQDEMAVRSHANAHKAQINGNFADEIVPVTTKLVDKNGTENPVRIAQDDGIRPSTNAQNLLKLKAVFKENGTTTAGNSSQVSDGAAAVVLARRSTAKKLNLPIMATMRSYAVVGVEPSVMGIGPAVAIPAVLEKCNLKIKDIDIFEINEAFASQATYSVQVLGIDPEKVNPKGGAIALGHPLGCTGARQISTLLYEMKRRGKKGSLGIVSMCIGTGMGAAAVIEYNGN